MKKILLCLILLFCPIIVFAKDVPDVSSEAVVLYQLNENKVIFTKNADKKLAPASLTKIMTILVAIEEIPNLDETVTLTSNMFQGLASQNASVAGFQIGEKVTYRDLLYGALFPSGGDATQALAILLEGSTEKFVEKMNEKANVIGMNDTHFENETGLPDINHFSTASDMALLLKEALKNEKFYELFTTRSYQTSNQKHTWIPSFLKTANTYHIDVDEILGGKTGFTNEAGYCLASLAQYNNVKYLLVTLHAPTSGSKAGAVYNSKLIYDYFKNNYGYQELIQKNEALLSLKTEKYSEVKNVDVISKENISYYLPNDYNKEELRMEYQGIEEISYGMKKGKKVGTVTYYYQNEKLGSVSAYLNQDISFSPFLFLKDHWLWIIFVFVIFMIIVFKITNKKRKKKKRKIK